MVTTALLETGNTFYFEWEVKLMEWLQSIFGSAVATKVFSFFSEFGEELICIAVLGIFYWGLNKQSGKFIGTNVLAQIIWNPMIKNIFVRRRPYFDNPSIKLLKKIDADADAMDIAAQGFSFPSGHSSTSATTYGSLFAKTDKKWLKIICVAIITLVGISRFVLGAHYPTDVLCGWAMGILIVIFIPLLQKKINNDVLFYGILLLSGIPGFFYCTSHDFYTGFGTMLGAFAGFLFDDRFVKFENTRNIFRCILRTLGGGIVYLVLNAVLKLPFSADFLAGETTAALLVRTFRYAIVLFAAVGLYPMLFKYTGRFFERKEK